MIKGLYELDSELLPYKSIIQKRHSNYLLALENLAPNGQTLSSISNSYLYYGLHLDGEYWVFREWAPNASEIYLVGEFSGWLKLSEFRLSKISSNGDWEIRLPKRYLRWGTLYKLYVKWQGGEGERIPSHCSRVVQDENTHLFSAEVYDMNSYEWKHSQPKEIFSPVVYEAHIGMSSEKLQVASFDGFRRDVLPRIAGLGYNTLQLMGIAQHPYYGSFGYQVSSLFAVSSWFGSPNDLRRLVDEAHALGIRVIMDLVHSHSVINETEGLSRFDGTDDLYFYSGDRGYHSLWNSRCFDYSKQQVINYLLSNCKYWLEEFRFDGFRFDGVTSMLYLNHGIDVDFVDYSMYYDGNQDENAICYLTLANKLIHELNPKAITIAEDMSGLPALAYPIEDGGLGFDYRMSMGVPDYWIKLTKDQKDEQWHVGNLLYELTNRRNEEKTISYCESHDQAMVGDQTLIFRLLGSEMYTSMSLFTPNVLVDRAIAIHKMIRLVTISTSGSGYLNFMGNEFGHPEWIDFPRQGNNWSFQYARRQWSLADDTSLRYKFLYKFDRDMIHTISKIGIFDKQIIPNEQDNYNQVLIFERGDYLFVFNFNPTNSYRDYTAKVKAGKYTVVLNTDDEDYGGNELINNKTEHFTHFDGESNIISLYVPSRVGFVLKRE